LSALAVLAAAKAAGVRLAAEGGGLGVEADSEPPPDLLAALRAHKLELVELLTGTRCKRCSEPIKDRGPRAWVPFADGTAAHDDCETRWHVEDRLRRGRAMFSPEVLADEAEVTLRGELA
jgi:hypothetical protein